jgi:hypothetical protein
MRRPAAMGLHGFQGGEHGFGAGVEGVVDDGHPVGPGEDLHPAPGGQLRAGQALDDAGERHACGEGDRGGGERVGDVVAAVDGQPDRRVVIAVVEGEARAAVLPDVYVLGPYVGLPGAEEHRAGPGLPRHRRHERVVRVEDRDAVRGQAAYDLGLRLGCGLAAAELAGVSRTDTEHGRDRRRGDLAQRLNVPAPARAHLQDQVLRLGGDLGDSDREADLVVERARRGHSRPGQGKDAAEQVLRGGLARRAGNTDDRAREPGGHLAGGVGHRGQDVRDEHGGGSDRARRQHGDRPVRDGSLGEVVAVGGAAGQAGEQPTWGDVARVEEQRRGNPRAGVSLVEIAAGRRCDVGEGQRDHAAPSSWFPSTTPRPA